MPLVVAAWEGRSSLNCLNAETSLELTAEAAHLKRQAVIAAQNASAKRNHDAHVAGATAAVQSETKKARPEI